MPLTVTENSDGSVNITYDLTWLLELMEISSSSMVPFAFFTARSSFVRSSRVYPRSRNNPGFILGPEGSANASPFAGGRQHGDRSLRVHELCAHFTEAHAGLSIPLSDVAIRSKRAVCAAVRAALSKKLTNFEVMRGLGEGDPRHPGFPVHDYPMLCIIGGPSAQFPTNQAEWRVVQCVFGAVLTRAIRTARIGIEVVSREGFGSVFPTLADLPDGIRLDPGLLPPDTGAAAIVEALRFADDFITAVRNKVKAPPKSKRGKSAPSVEAVSTMVSAIGDLGGMDKKNLAAVDRLMSTLHGAVQSKGTGKGKLTPDECAELILAWGGKGSDDTLPALTYEVDYLLPNAVPKVSGPRRKRAPEPKEESGYGSESEYEDDEPVVKKSSKGDGDEQLDLAGDLAVKKASVISGMAALRMALYYGMRYSKLLSQERKNSAPSSLVEWAPYFELDVHDLYKGLEKNQAMPPGVRALICDGAPNPINIPAAPIKLTKDFGVIVIDTTNNTSSEKAAYMVFFQEYLVQPKALNIPGGLLFMVDSASKHPTGGDLVHGVMRVCGSRASVQWFFKHALKKHLTFGEYSARGLTVLSAEETDARRQMIACRLVMRNGDLFNSGPISVSVSSETSGSELGGSKKGGSKFGGSKFGGGGVDVLDDMPDIPLLAMANLRKVKRVMLGDVPVQVPKPSMKQKKKEALSESADLSGKPSEKVAKKEQAKAFEALGHFDAEEGLPDLTVEGFYYEAENIYDLQRFKLRDQPHVAVLYGVSRPQWLQMTHEAYTTAYQSAITTNTTIIIQPLNRGGNHWALLYIKLSAPDSDGRRRARLLYIDPLNPGDVPVDDLALLNLPFPGIEVEHCVLRYQDDGFLGQHSCGAWVVMLAEHLARNGHVLPDVDVDPKTAAIALREAHNELLPPAHDHPWPVAPAVHLHVHAPPAVGLPVLRRRGSMNDLSSLAKSPSLGELMRKGESSGSLGELMRKGGTRRSSEI